MPGRGFLYLYFKLFFIKYLHFNAKYSTLVSSNLNKAIMKTGTKEFYEMMDQFERDLSKMPVYVGAKPEREKRTDGTPKEFFYTNGKINDLFHAYMMGYALGRLNHMH